MACDCTPCEILDAINIDSSDNSVSVEKKDCGYDIKFLPNNLNNILSVKDGDCISFTTEYINGVLTLTPKIDFDCVAEKICGKCEPEVTCSQVIQLLVTPL